MAKKKISSNRSFGLVFAGFFALVACLPWLHGGGIRLWAVGVAAVFLALAYTAPKVLYPFNYAWCKLGIWLGMVVAPVVMLLVFLVAVTPTALVMRLLGKDILRLKINKGAKSYWIERDPQTSPIQSMKHQF